MAEEEPVIVTGGSVTVDFSDTFTDEGSSNGKKKFKKYGSKLLRVEVNGVKVADLQPDDQVEIIYKP
jgi:hypothetical protein